MLAIVFLRSTGGYALFDQGSTTIDLILYLLGVFSVVTSSNYYGRGRSSDSNVRYRDLYFNNSYVISIANENRPISSLAVPIIKIKN